MPTKDPRFEEYDYEIPPSTLEIIDAAVVDYVNKELDLFATTNKGWKKVPVLWVAAERSYQRKKNKELRDAGGTLKLPLIAISRTEVLKDPVKKGTMGVNIPAVRDKMGNQFSIGKVINQTRTARQLNAKSARKTTDSGHAQKNMREWTDEHKTPVFDIITVPLPVYIDVKYSISLRTGYQQQMNELLTPFITRAGQKNDLRLRGEHHQYLAHIDSNYTKNNNISEMNEEERVYETEISMIVNGYLMGDGPNQDRPKVVRRQSATVARWGRERSVLGDINDWMEKDPLRGKLRDDYDENT